MRRWSLMGMIGLVCFLVGSNLVLAETTDNYFPLKVGNHWTYELTFKQQKIIGEYQVTQETTLDNQAVIVVETSFNGMTQQKEYFLVNTQGIYTVMRSLTIFNFKFEPYQYFFKYPVVVGDAWEQSGVMTEADQNFTTVYNLKSTYQALEEVEVAAGKFKAVRFHMVINTSDGSRADVTRYLVNGVGVVKEEIIMTTGTQMTEVSSQLLRYQLTN